MYYSLHQWSINKLLTSQRCRSAAVVYRACSKRARCDGMMETVVDDQKSCDHFAFAMKTKELNLESLTAYITHFERIEDIVVV